MTSKSRSLSELKLSDFDFELPDSLIAQEPLARRDASRLLHLPLSAAPLSHRLVGELPELLLPGDLLVFNDARVIPARLRGRKAETGGKLELLLVESLERGLPGQERWFALGQGAKRLHPGQVLEFAVGLEAVVEEAREGGVVVALNAAGDALMQKLWEAGEIPLPPYIQSAQLKAKSDPQADRYQTIFARAPGASAAPTAGLHFTPELLTRLEQRGIQRALVTLLVGPGTFLPVRSENLSQHRMHAERYDIPPETVEAIAQTRARGGRVIAVGTTTLRALEAAAGQSARDALGAAQTSCSEFGEGNRKRSVLPKAGPGSTDIFIVPGYKFQVVDGLMSNFHLPKSTLLMLVSALAGRERILAAYREAVAQEYRFFSYGDAMLLL